MAGYSPPAARGTPPVASLGVYKVVHARRDVEARWRRCGGRDEAREPRCRRPVSTGGAPGASDPVWPGGGAELIGIKKPHLQALLDVVEEVLSIVTTLGTAVHTAYYSAVVQRRNSTTPVALHLSLLRYMLRTVWR